MMMMMMKRRISCQNMIRYSGWSLFSAYSVSQLNYLLPYLVNIACGVAVITGGVSLSVCVVACFVYKKEIVEDVLTDTDNDKYVSFINNDYERFIDIYKNNAENYFTTVSKKFVDDLRLKENHETYQLPYSYNPKIIFYYDSREEEFHYFCQSDVSSKILNSVCRTYAMNKKCIQLFNDEEEIEYMKRESQGIVDVSFSTVEPCKDECEEEVEVKTSTDNDDSNEFVNIFYNKNQKQTNMETEDNEKTNKYVYKGTIVE